ncbi:MAG: hypothetical protein V3V04_03790 [Rhizobiaceae bacterium]
MRRILSSFGTKFSFGVVLATSVFAFSTTSASAIDYSGEAHCFKNGVSTDMLYPEDEYANGQLQDEGQIQAVEELTKRQWKLRLSNLPFVVERRNWRAHPGNHQRIGGAFGSIILERAQRRANRRTGSKYMYVTPDLKTLAHERGLVRALKRKPCNPNMLYLGTN